MQKTLNSRKHRALIDFLIQQREMVGMTQAELAAAIGEYQSLVARLESGQRRVDVVELMTLAEVLRFDVHDALRELSQVPD